MVRRVIIMPNERPLPSKFSFLYLLFVTFLLAFTQAVSAQSLSLVKEVINLDGGTATATDWTLSADGPDPTLLSGAGGVAATDVPPGYYTLSESAGPAGYTPGDWSCTVGNLDGDLLFLAAGEDAVCTIRNYDRTPATYDVCPSGCDYDSPVTAINNPERVPGDIIDVQADFVLGARLDIDKDLTIEGNGSIFDATGDRAMWVNDANTDLTLNDLIIQNGQPFHGTSGGALWITNGATVITNDVTFENNRAGAGGAIHNAGSVIALYNSRLLGNHATAGEGGAIWTTDGGFTQLMRTEVDGNMASDAGGGLSVNNIDSHLHLAASTVSNNMALAVVQTVSNVPAGVGSVSCPVGQMGQTFSADASALSAFEFDIRVDSVPGDILITGQVRRGGPLGAVVATSTISVPGGLWPDSSDQTLTFNLDRVLPLTPGAIYSIETTIAGNYTIKITDGDYLDGAAYYCSTQLNDDDLVFRTFGGNFGDGGGIYASDSASVSLVDSTVSSNLGEGIFNASDAYAQADYSTIANNTGNGFTAPAGSYVILAESIIAGNGGNDCSGEFMSMGYNLIGDDSNCLLTPIGPSHPGDLTGTSTSPIDPLLGPLQDNGGLTPTHALATNSPAVDAADPACAVGRLDQRDVVRPIGSACDIGAVEMAPIQTLIDAADPGDVVNVPDGVYNELITIGEDKTLRGSSVYNVEINGDALGGSVITADGDFTLWDISVASGSSPDNGGGMLVIGNDKTVLLSNVVFENNDAAQSGGAIYLQGGIIRGSNVTFTDNRAADGGAIRNDAGEARFLDSVFFGNQATVGNGGAILTDNEGHTILNGAVVDGNFANTAGGGLSAEEEFTILTVTAVTVSDNEAGNMLASGIHVSDSAFLDLGTSTVSGNVGVGVIVASGSSMRMAYSTVTGNINGIFVPAGSSAQIQSSIIAANDGNDCNGSIVSRGYNLIGDDENCTFTRSTGDLVGFSADPVDPLLGPLQDNGGFSYTHAIAPNSPAVNGVGSAFVEGCSYSAMDQRDVTRLPYGGYFCDIGAYEAPVGPFVLGRVDLLSDGVGFPSPISLAISYPGVVDVPIIDIPIEKLTGDAANPPESAPLGSFPLGSFPIGSFDLQNSPIGSFPLGSFPIGSFPIGSFPLGSFPLSSIPLLYAGGWTDVLKDTDLEGAPLQTVTLEQALRLEDAFIDSIQLRDLSIQGSPLASLSLPGLSLGATTVKELDDWIDNDGGTDTVCATLTNTDKNFTDCLDTDTLLGLEMAGAPVSALSLSSLPLGSFPTNSTPLGSFPIGSFPLGSFPIGSFPIGSFPIGSFPIGSFPLGSFPLGSFPIGSFPLGSFDVDGKPFCEFYDEHLESGDLPCLQLVNPVTDGLAELIKALIATTASDIDSTPLGSFPIGSFPIGSFPIGSFPLGSFPIGSFPIGSFPIGSFPIGSFPISSLTVASFPLGSFDIDGTPFCVLYDQLAEAANADTCGDMFTDPFFATLADLVAELAKQATTIGSTPLGSFPIGSFPIGSFKFDGTPLGSFPLGSFDLEAPPLSEITLRDFDGCNLIAENSSDTCGSLNLNIDSTLKQVADAYGGSLASSPLGSFPIGSFGISEMPMGSFPIGSFEINGTPLGSFPLGSFDLINSPLGSFPIGSFSDGTCAECLTLADAERAGVIDGNATLSDLKTAQPTMFATLTLGEILDAMTLETLYGEGTLADIEDPGHLTLGQILIAMMMKTDFPWETIPLDELEAQEFSADHWVSFRVIFELSGTGVDQPFTVSTTIADDFLYETGSASLGSRIRFDYLPTVPVADPLIVDNGDGTQTLTFDLNISGYRLTTNTLRFITVPPMALGSYDATAWMKIGDELSMTANDRYAGMWITPDGRTDPGGETSDPVTVPADILVLGFIDTANDHDFFLVEPPAAGNRVAVFMANPASDNDLIMYEPLTTVEAKGQTATATALDSIPFEDDGVDYEGNLTEEPNALEDVNLNLNFAPLASISTNREDADESVSAIAGDTEPFTIQVSGYNGATSDEPYTLRVKITPEVPDPVCSARSWPNSAVSTVATTGSWQPNTNAVFLVNGARLASSDPNGAAGADAALTAINNLVNAPGVTDGVVVDVSDILLELGVANYYDIWDANPCDADAANAIVNAITQYLEEKRLVSPKLSYVTIVGSDEVIPFARKPDETSIANESTFAGEFSDNAMYGALVTRHFLSDDTYGDIDPIAWLDRYLNVPELAVGRLVESAEDIQTAAENYIAFAGILDPNTALSAGYDFIADASEYIDETFNTYGPVLGFSVETALIDQPDVDPLTAWTRSEFLSAAGLIGPNPTPVDMVSFNMHFDFDEALPSSGDANDDYKTNLITTADLGNTDLAGGIWFTVGCHSGTNVADISVIGSAPKEDWAQSFSRLGALYLAQNAYGLGDTEAIALTERLMANFARNLNGSVTIGQAHAYAKQQYFADLGLYGEYDFKALQAATLFGLPMYQYGYGQVVAEPLPPVLPVSKDPISGLTSASWSMTDTGITETSTNKGDLFSVDGEVQFVHFRPLQPIVRRDVTGPNGEIASGAFLTSLVTEDILVDDIAFARPVIALGKIEPEVETDVISFPTAFTNIANFMAPPPLGGPFAPRQQLNVIVGQFTSLPDGISSGTERLFHGFEAQVFYRSTPDDFMRPEFDNVEAGVTGPSGAQQAAFSVDVFDEGEVLRVAVLYLKSVNNDGTSTWALANLVKGASNATGGHTWTGGGPVDLGGGDVDYMIQAVDSNGNVANSTFKGHFYVAKELPSAPAPSNGQGTIGIILSAVGCVVSDPSQWITCAEVNVQVTDQSNDANYVYSVDSGTFDPLMSSSFNVTGDGVHTITIQESDGKNPVTFVVMIDTTPPQAVITRPVNNEFVIQGQEPAARYDCLDAGSGIASCLGTVANGTALPSVYAGNQSFSVLATDNAGLESAAAENSYYVVQALAIDVPGNPTEIGDLTTVTVNATDLTEFTETATIDWGDETISIWAGSDSSEMTRSGDMFSAVHLYAEPGVYLVKVMIDYGNGVFIQTGEFKYASVYDPNGDFLTGGGWINSPPSSYTPYHDYDPDVTGVAHFSLNLKYKNGHSVPTGSNSFRFTAGDLKFAAMVYDWLVISDAFAYFSGEGTINDGSEPYKFLIIALDSDISGAGVSNDGFAIRIWQEATDGSVVVLYDNLVASGEITPLGSGSITIHRATATKQPKKK